jgi:homoserine O-succinyltransferase
MEQFYRPFSEVLASGEKFDGLVITGAPIETMPFTDVTYWDELKQVFEWTQTHVHSTFGVCWGGMAMINHFHDVKKYELKNKAFGLFKHNNLAPSSPYLRGFSDECYVPVSRWTEMRASEIEASDGLVQLLGSDETGPCLVQDPKHRALYIFNHFEYDTGTLHEELMRDKTAGKPIIMPKNYYPDDDPSQRPSNRWRSHAHLLYGNWINEIYQSTQYDLAKIGS